MSKWRKNEMSRIVRSLVVLLLTGLALFGQQYKIQSPDLVELPNWAAIAVSPNDLRQPGTPGNIVTIQELSHRVPIKARKEMEKAEKARLDNHPDEAISHLNEAIQIDPRFVAARNTLAVIYFATAATSTGIEQLKEAVKYEPRNSMLFMNLAIGYVLIYKYDDAERVARMAADLDRIGPRPPMLLGMVLLLESKFTEEALQCFERTRDDFPLAHLLAGRVLMAQGSPAEAKSEIHAYLASGDQDHREVAALWLDMLDQIQQRVAGILSH
jgi:tetratricopeptide (TPR) repeat protein